MQENGDFTVAGVVVPWQRRVRAKRLILRVTAQGTPQLTVPPGCSLRKARAFVESRSDWLVKTLEKVGPARLAEVGALLPVAGTPREITPGAVKAAMLDDERLIVPAKRPVGMAVATFLRARALTALTREVDALTAALGRQATALAMRDTRGRWGSCSSQGRLMFNWRLAMAPPEVLRYVAAHEVAHLAHMDHSARFWAAVEGLMPDYGAPRLWLRQHGGGLLAWQFKPVLPAGPA